MDKSIFISTQETSISDISSHYFTDEYRQPNSVNDSLPDIQKKRASNPKRSLKNRLASFIMNGYLRKVERKREKNGQVSTMSPVEIMKHKLSRDKKNLPDDKPQKYKKKRRYDRVALASFFTFLTGAIFVGLAAGTISAFLAPTGFLLVMISGILGFIGLRRIKKSGGKKRGKLLAAIPAVVGTGFFVIAVLGLVALAIAF